MQFGGDSDTICSMAGALAGAYYGESSIPEYMKNLCEAVDNAKRQADQLHKLVTQ
jgi:ADP-ribosylglycohydrolase